MNIPRTPVTLRTLLRALEDPLLIVRWGFALAGFLWGTGVDVDIQVWLNANYDQEFNTAMRILGELGKGTTQVALCLLVGGVWAFKGWRCGCVEVMPVRRVLLAVPVFLLAGIVNWVLKWSIGRSRPKEFLWNGADPYVRNAFEMSAQWWSFPSGHSCSTFAIAVWLGLCFPRFRVVFWLVATVLSFSRFLALTPHYLGDVVAGAAVGTAIAWAVWNIRCVYVGERHA